MKKILIIVICSFVVIALVIAGFSFYNEFFTKKYIFEDIKDVGRLIHLDGEVVSKLNDGEYEKFVSLVKNIAVYHKTDSTEKLPLATQYLNFGEKHIEYDGVRYTADKEALSALIEYCEAIIDEHNDATPKKPYELSVEDISSVKLTCHACEDMHLYDVASEDFSVFVESVNGITAYERFNAFNTPWGGGSYVFDVTLKSGEALQIRVAENTFYERLFVADKVYVSDASKLMDFIGACTVTE